MRKVSSWKLVVGSIFFISLLLTPYSLLLTVNAHVLKTNGGVGVVMHINPDDDPIAKQPATFFLEFKDKNNNFQLAKCQCEIFIYENGKQIFSDLLYPVSTNDPNSANFQFIFPQKDIYQIQIIGSPNAIGEFEEFKLTFDLRVDKEAAVTITNPTQTNPVTDWLSSRWPHLVGVLLVIGFLVLAFFRQRSLNTKKR